MKQRNQTFGNIVVTVGIILIFVGFFLFVPQEKRNNIFWLDLITVCLVFLISSNTELGLFGINFDFEKQVGGLGVRIIVIRIYSILAIGFIAIGYFAKLHFNYQLFFQLLAAFILLVGYYFTTITSDNAVSVQTVQNIERKGKDEILKSLNQFDILFVNDISKWGAVKHKINILKEECRYLSPTNNESTLEIESKILTIIQDAYVKATNQNEDGHEIFSLLNKCEELLKIRINSYSN
jgi:hypothetical protein